MTKQTLGSIIKDLSQKSQETTTIIDQQRAMQEGYMKNLLEAVDRGYKKYPGDFFIDVEKKAEVVLNKTFRTYYIDRLTCPTPNYDQDVYRYNRQKGEIEYLWSIPDKETTLTLIENALEVVPEEKSLLNFCLKFADGTLFRLCKQYNGEKLETPQLEKKDLSFSVTK